MTEPKLPVWLETLTRWNWYGHNYIRLADVRAAWQAQQDEGERLSSIVEEFVGWWHLNREGSVNRTFDHIDKTVKQLRAALPDPPAEGRA